MQAKRAGPCHYCPVRIKAGEWILWDTVSKFSVHVGCERLKLRKSDQERPKGRTPKGPGGMPF